MQVTKLRLLEAPLRLPDESGVDFVASAAVPEGPTTAQRNHVIFCAVATYVDADTCLCSVFKEPVPSSGRGRTLPGSPFSVNRKVAVSFVRGDATFWKDRFRLASGAEKIGREVTGVKDFFRGRSSHRTTGRGQKRHSGSAIRTTRGDRPEPK